MRRGLPRSGTIVPRSQSTQHSGAAPQRSERSGVVRTDSGPRRGGVLIAVILLHAGLVLVVSIVLRSPNGSAPRELVSTLILLQPPPPSSPVPPGVYPARPSFAPSSTAITVPPVSAPVTGPIDWDVEAQSAAAAVTGARRARSLGHHPAAAAAPTAASPASAVHHAGEEYRDTDGTSIVFVSDRCFVASSPPPPGVPDVIARAIPTRTVCKGDPGWSRADLFKDLPAYRRYHPDTGAKP